MAHKIGIHKNGVMIEHLFPNSDFLQMDSRLKGKCAAEIVEELYRVMGAGHVDLYDRVNLNPFD